MAIKRRSSKVKSGIVPGPLTGQKTPRQIAKQCGIHPHSLELWKKESPGRVA
jgi:transposase-like protein